MQGQGRASAFSEARRTIRSRRERAQGRQRIAEQRAAGVSIREAANAEGVPLSTAYRWLARAERGDARSVERAFLSSPEGLAMLHRIVTSAQLVFVQAGGCGADRVSEFLILCDLDEHVAASHGSQLGTAARVTKLLGEYGDAQRAQLGATMAPRRIVVCEDETFHPAICLVAIDAESGMILLERYAPRRDGETWTTALAAELEGLPVEIVRVVGDEAKGLIAHARRGLGVEHGADLFHIQHDLSAATARALAQRLAEPRRRLDEAQAATQAWRDRKAEYERGPRGPGRPMNYDRRIEASLAVEAERQAVLDAALADQAAVHGAILELGDAYHPVDLETGDVQSDLTLRGRLDAVMARIDAVAQRIRLPKDQRERIDKARRVLPKLLAGLTFFHGELERALAALALTPDVLTVVRNDLLPGLYLARAAKRGRDRDQRHGLRALSDTLLARARDPASPFMALAPDVRDHVEAVISSTLALFVRSTACVEGRNGHLARYHHGLHRLSDARLRALTVIANYYARRDDGTTAAERFFGRPPEDLFTWLLERLDPPAQPRTSRAKAAA